MERESLGELLRKRRKEAGKSQADVALAMGTTQSAIARVESGRGPDPTIGFVDRYATALGTQIHVTVGKPPAAVSLLPQLLVREAARIGYLASGCGFHSIRLVGAVARGEPDASGVEFMVIARASLGTSARADRVAVLHGHLEELLECPVTVIDMASVGDIDRRLQLILEAVPV